MGSLTFSCGAIGIMGMAIGMIGLVSDISYFTEIIAGCQSGEIPSGKAAFLIGEMIGQAIGSTFGAKIGGEVAGSVCFTAGTTVKSSEGDKPIEEIKVGDLVYAKDIDSEEYAYKKVVNTFERETNVLIKIYVGDTVIETTEEHPFYIDDLGYLEADNLLEGYEVVLEDGTTQTIDKIEKITLQNNVKVYNFEVEEYNNYFVSELGILVHNKCTSRKNQQRSIFKEYTGKDAINEVHHGFPEEFHKWFGEHGIDVNSGEWFYDLPKDIHRLKKGNGIHTNNNPLGKTWNKVWEEFKIKFPDPTPKQLEQQLKYMEEVFGIEKYRATKEL